MMSSVYDVSIGALAVGNSSCVCGLYNTSWTSWTDDEGIFATERGRGGDRNFFGAGEGNFTILIGTCETRVTNGSRKKKKIKINRGR